MNQSSKLDHLVSIVLTVATLIALGFLIEGRFNPPRAAGRQNLVVQKADWAKLATGRGIPLEDVSNPIRVDVFTDFQCPFCFVMDSALSKLEKMHPNKITRTVYEFPIPSHPHAKDAARAFECAAEQHRAAQMHHELYANQAQLGQTAWSAFASMAGVQNVRAFDQCLFRDATAFKIDSGLALGHRLGVTATPTVLVNGWIFDPSFPADIEAAVTAVLAGKSPNHR